MSFDLHALRAAIHAHGVVARVVVAAVEGSTPREVGAAMLVWDGGQSGTIGGGTLEFEAASRAFCAPRLSRIALGPSLGQCCGGAVTILSEVFDSVEEITGEVYARGPGEMPFGVKKALAEARAQGTVEPMLLGEWMIEPVAPARRPLWVWGAGHVGRAIVGTLAPLPDFAITWVDTGAERFPDALPEGVDILYDAAPETLMRYAPENAEHLIVTFSHTLDLALCHGALLRGFASAGLIGSKTKWARFRSRLRDLGHSDAQISRICCPIGQPELGKHPQAIAVGVAARLISRSGTEENVRGCTG
ncbi:xanthine dehydrogenase accessory protein XdhC [Celeribacter arenosi]|uniref:Xanthine dehydrogenase accessory protein XdhC n=1 Tax=Celeribacter arenosi TaxID=792649 RepID=A0ABP7K4R4_9RHOB